VTYYQDLSPLTYFDDSPLLGPLSTHLVAVGWLHPEYPMSPSEVPPPAALMDKLWALGSNGGYWGLFSFLGYHGCGFCPNAPDKTATLVTYKGETRETGAKNIWVPGQGKIFVAPSLVYHYVLEHQYRLPVEFRTAVVQSPLPGTRAYDRALRQNGPPVLRSLPDPRKDPRGFRRALEPPSRKWWQFWR
jgi:hypothetical protein